MSDIMAVTDATFETEVLKSSTTVLVDFWAPWCGPCKAIAPILDELAGSFAGKLKIVKLNVDESQDIAAQFAVRAIPTLLIFKQGKVVGTKSGMMPKSQMNDFINEHIA